MKSVPHIQPYAQVIGVDATTFRVVCYSDNLPPPVGGAAGAHPPEISQLLSDATLQAARASAGQPFPRIIPLSEREPVAWGERQIVPHQVGSCLLLEIEPRHRPRALTADDLQVAQLTLTAQLKAADSLQSIMDIGCRQLTEVLGLERGCFYQLDYPGGPGQVTAETLNGGLPSIAGVHFRSGDIPEEGYRKLEYDPLVAYANDGRPFVSVLGDTSPFASAIDYRIGARLPFSSAVDYVQNNDLGGYCVIAIDFHDRLLGLLCGHSRQVTMLDHQHRLFLYRCKMELEGALKQLSDRRRHRTHRAIDQRRNHTRQSIGESTSLFRGLTEARPPLLDYPGMATGMAISIDGEMFLSGLTPGQQEVEDLLQWAAEQGKDGDLYVTHSLSGLYPSAEAYPDTAAGALLIPLGRKRADWIGWFRPEQVTMAEYGSRDLTHYPAQTGKRFTMTKELRRGHSIPWTEEQIMAARDLQSFIEEVVISRYKQLARMNERLRTAYAELEDFSYTVSHDLRAPLRGIDGYAEILLEEHTGELSTEAAELVRVIQHNAARMNQSITDILELSRVGRVQLRVNDCDVARLVELAREELIEEFGNTVEIELREPLPKLRGDCKQLLMVFKQLLSNAVKYSSKQAERRITVGFRPEGDDGGGRFYVSDNGIGIAAQHQERIFGLFNRLIVEKEYSGNGVGLAIVKRIIHRHNGRVSIESEVGRGATFLFYTDVELPTPQG